MNLLSLGADAWDDSALVDAFNNDLKIYKEAHKNQLIDLSKVSDMINFNKAKKINQQNAKSKLSDNDHEDDEDDEHDSILAPSFVPFANEKKTDLETGKTNKYSSWPPQKTNKGNKRKHKKKQNRKKQQNQSAETENLAKMYEEQ